MRSFFSKIFIWFWLAMIFNIALAISIFHLITQDERARMRRPPHDDFFTEAFSMCGEQGVVLYETGGHAAFRSYAQKLTAKGKVDAFLLYDKTGGNFSATDRAMLELVTDRLWLKVRNEQDGEWVARVLRGRNGHEYVVVFLLDASHPKPPFPLAYPFFVYLLACLITASCFCYWLARHFSAPLHYLRSLTQRLTSGDLKSRVDGRWLTRRDEIAGLADDFNAMASHIENLITGQHRLLRDISHELRSPLARLNIALELAKLHAGDKAQAAIQRIERESTRLNSMIGELLLIAKYSTEDYPVKKKPVCLNELLQKIVADANFEAGSRDCKVTLCAHCEIFVSGVEDLLASAMENVVRNAVYYTAAGTEVNIALALKQQDGKSCARISIEDHGPGVPQHAVSQLFQPFYRVDETRDRKTGGTGLGLAISYRAVRIHDGTINAYNGASGGLTVEVCLPDVLPAG